MPIKYREIRILSQTIDEKVCNKCKKSFKENLDDMIGWEEFFHVKFMGGFGSVFGDEAEIEINLCQDCLKEILGPYINIEENGE